MQSFTRFTTQVAGLAAAVTLAVSTSSAQATMSQFLTNSLPAMSYQSDVVQNIEQNPTINYNQGQLQLGNKIQAQKTGSTISNRLSEALEAQVTAPLSVNSQIDSGAAHSPILISERKKVLVPGIIEGLSLTVPLWTALLGFLLALITKTSLSPMLVPLGMALGVLLMIVQVQRRLRAHRK